MNSDIRFDEGEGPAFPMEEPSQMTEAEAKAAMVLPDPLQKYRGLQITEEPKRESEEDSNRVPFFYIDDRLFTLPAEIPPYLVFRYLDRAKKRGVEFAFADMLETVVGEGTLEALANHKTMTKKDMKELIDALQKRVLGALELGE